MIFIVNAQKKNKQFPRNLFLFAKDMLENLSNI